MGRIIAIANQKGGVGKTTTAINLSACLAEAKQRVLVIDIDPQGNTTSGLGIDKEEKENTIYEVMLGEISIEQAICKEAFDCLDVIPSNVNLAGAEIDLIDIEDREYILKKSIAQIRKNYDYIILDCPPSLSMLTVNAMTAADTVLVPIQCEYYALEGLTQLIHTIHLVQKKLNPNLELEGVVFTMYDSRTNLSLQVVENVKEVVVKEPGEMKVRLSQIEPNREQPRKVFDEDALIELSESIKQYGVLQPLLVQKKDKYYEIIAGERRWRAAKLAGVKEVPVIIKDYSTQEVMEIALIENIQREDLNPIEEAQAYQRLIKDYRLKQDEVAEKVSKSRAAITNSLRLLKLDERVQEMVMEGKLSNGHARAIIGIEDGDQQYQVAQKIFDEQMSVRETEKLMKNLNRPEKPEKQKPQNDFVYRDIEEKMNKIMGTKVVIKNREHDKGKIEIEYYSQAELERIYDLLKQIKNE